MSVSAGGGGQILALTYRPMRSRLALALGLLLCGASTSAAAQTYDTSYVLVPPSRCVIPDSEMTRVAVYAWVDLPDSASPELRPAAENLLQDVVNHVPPLLGGAPGVLPQGEPAVRWFDLDVPLEVTARRDGHVTWRAVGTRDTAAAGLLGRALAHAIADGDGLVFDSTMVADSVRFRFELAWPKVTPHGVEPMDVKHTALPVFSVAYPLRRQVVPMTGNRAPHYPVDARTRGYTGMVLMSFIVDTTGHAVMATAHDVWPADKPRLKGEAGLMYDEFLDAVRSDLPTIRFYPASAGDGCRFDQLVQMPFAFKLSR